MPSNTVVSMPATFAAASTPWAIVATKGTAIVEVMIQICLPFSFEMSKASPGGTNFGFCMAFSTSALASASPSARAGGVATQRPCKRDRHGHRQRTASAPTHREIDLCSHFHVLLLVMGFCPRQVPSRVSAQAACSRATKRANVTAISKAAPLNISCTHEEVPRSSRPVTPVTSR